MKEPIDIEKLAEQAAAAYNRLLTAYNELKVNVEEYAKNITAYIQRDDRLRNKLNTVGLSLTSVDGTIEDDIEMRVTALVKEYQSRSDPDEGMAMEKLKSYFLEPAQRRLYPDSSITSKTQTHLGRVRDLEAESKVITPSLDSLQHAYPLEARTNSQRVGWLTQQYLQKVRKEQEEVIKENEVFRREERIRKVLTEKGFGRYTVDLGKGIEELANDLNTLRQQDNWVRALDELNNYLKTTALSGETPEEKIHSLIEDHRLLRQNAAITIAPIVEETLRNYVKARGPSETGAEEQPVDGTPSEGRKPATPSSSPPGRRGDTPSPLPGEATKLDIEPAPPSPQELLEKLREIEVQEDGEAVRTPLRYKRDRSEEIQQKYYQELGLDFQSLYKPDK